MPISWITLYPQWYLDERRRIEYHYPEFEIDEYALDKGVLRYYGELTVRPSGGASRYPVKLEYPEGTPFMPPIVVPLESMPEFNEHGKLQKSPQARLFDYRHQMPSGALCLFQREVRGSSGGDVVRGTDALRRAQQWFLGLCTGHWPPDSAESELEAHFLQATDVLLSNVFFSSDIQGHGCFYMVPDLRRLMESKSDDVCPMIVVALTEETGVSRVLDARDDLSRIYPWIQSDLWNPQRVAEIESGNEPGEVRKGYWWSLPAEPRPFRNGEGLLRELAIVAPDEDAWRMVSSALKAEMSLSEHHFLGLRYPDRQESIEWLVLWMPRGKRSQVIRTDEQKRDEFNRSPVYCLRAHTARPGDLRFRNTGVVDDIVQNKTVALIGLGALGSTVAELLAKAGVGQFRLCDCDRLSTGNVARHIGGLNEFGALKTLVVANRLLEINPYLRFSQENLISGSAVASLERLAEFIGTADITISTTADESVESIINQVAVIHRKTVIYGRSLRRGSMGRVFLARPGTDACKECLSEYARKGRQGEEVPPDWIEVTESEDDILLHECSRPVIPASAIDVSFTAALIARAALDVLEGNDTETNHWLWSRQPVPDIDCRLDREMHVLPGRLEPRFGCPACQKPDVVRLVMSKEVHETTVALAESSPDAETGGILIGFVDENRRAIVLRATGPGPRAERTRARFSRDVEYVQMELDRAASELGERGAYVGEWHSHLVTDPQPSPIDVESLFGVSAAPNYLTRCPVMVITGFDRAVGKVVTTNSWAFPVGGRMYRIENEVEGWPKGCVESLTCDIVNTLHKGHRHSSCQLRLPRNPSARLTLD